MESFATCVDIEATDVQALLDFAQTQAIDLTVVGPESSLVAGIVDAFEEKGLRIFGPNQKGAKLEGSKVFAKTFLEKYAIPTAQFKVFTDRKKAKKYIEKKGSPLVVKADGLAAGKGVVVAQTVSEAKKAVDTMMEEKAFGDAGNTILIEQCLTGEEASFIAFTDGKTILPLPSSQDHKAIFSGDKGPNTGGMGAYSPAPIVTDEIADYVMQHILQPTVEGLKAEGCTFKGMLYAGLMIDGDKINVLEFNCRFGDPEAQPLLMRLKNDIVDIFNACIDTCLESIKLDIDPRPAVCVVLSSHGYPGKYTTGKRISGLSAASRTLGVEVFHAGTAKKNGRIVTAGGRVLGVCALGNDLQKARDRAYRALDKISWTGVYCRRDIGSKALKKNLNSEGPRVGIVMGSDSDLEVMRAAASFLLDMGIAYEITVASAHRTPDRAVHWAATAKDRGLKVIIAGAGMAAHLAGVLTAHTDLPVIGVPLDASPLQGLDALLSTVQMPPGVPVASMGIGPSGARNAAVFAARILALNDPLVAQKLCQFRQKMADEVLEKAEKIEQQ
ncbi:unnamed protein product [Cyprideis torosa]|uniref:Glycinamide ribonucleotide synthetase n=1 Tax=Cyprideis torosa TaxID=163714 RepID=A0A7R8WKR8_9CRUS|nr:unnamed protein product [Cyprideis torosa]CAG0903508.1 unnamed protein product [Cyprideis torosa]